ncbi:MAG: glycosyltransferase family 4 protein [Anaerolineae bacterium]|nr:glycosyltransferase family 4 protein [Anaerolineae bacterium]
MTTLIYLSLARIPTEKAHGLQIIQNCEAFADAGATVRLWLPRRINTPAMQAIDDVYAHYGVAPHFTIEYLPIVDVMPQAGGRPALERLAFYLHVLTFTLAVLLRLRRTQADIYYSRDETVLLALSLFLPRRRLAYEAHLFRTGRAGAWLQRQVVRRCGSSIAITPALRDDLLQRGGHPDDLLTAHDGLRAARFAHLPEAAAARAALGLPADAFIVGFVGRLHMLNVSKGLDTLVDALAGVEGAWLLLVGGPADMAAALQERWRSHGRPAAQCLYAGQVPPPEVPRWLAAMDVCAMPHPPTQQFARYTSPLKLFEYMAAGRAIVASDLPGWADVLTHEVNALLVTPGDVAALTAALIRLHADAALRARLGQAARSRAMQEYTWAARARAIQQHLQRPPRPREP